MQPPNQPPAPSAALQVQLDALRRRHRRVAAATGLARITGLLVLVLAAEMGVDYWFDLPWAARAVVLLAGSAAVCAMATLEVILPWLHPPDDDTLALRVEQARGELRGRLIAAVQLTRPGAVPSGAAPGLVQALVEETERLAAPVDFRRVVKTGDLKKFGAWAGVILLVAGAAFWRGGADARDLLRRASLARVPVPRKTRVFVADRNRTIGRGDHVVIEATASGVIPKAGTLATRSVLQRGEEFAMPRASNAPSRFAVTIENVQQSFDYVVRLNDGASPVGSIRVLPRPALARLECEQEFPAYTGRPRTKRLPGDLTLLAGSKLRCTAIATKPIRRAAATLEGLGQTLPLRLSPDNPKQLAGEIVVPAQGLTGFTIHLTDTDGMEARDPAVYRIETVPDKAPSVRLTAPERKEELVTRQGVLLVGFDAVDDFKVAKARLRYRAGEAANAEVKSVELDLSGADGARWQRRFEWKMSDAARGLPYGTRLEFWMEVEDNNDVTGPGRGTSEHQLVRIVTDDEKRADLLNRAGDFLGTIGDLASDQEKLNQSLGALIREKLK